MNWKKEWRDDPCIEKSNDDLVKINHDLNNLLLFASHDLQEPLRKIKTYAGMLEKAVTNSVDAQNILTK